MDIISSTFEDYSQGLRILLEAHTRAFRYGLMRTDWAEAAGNIDIGLTAVLNAFHSIHDATGKAKSITINMYEIPECATLLALRNARHHNKAHKIRELHRYHAEKTGDITKIRHYIIVNFPSTDPTATSFEVYLSWGDFSQYLDLPQKDSFLRPSAVSSINSYLNNSAFAKYRDHYGKKYSQIFFNVVPLIINASIRLLPYISKYITPRSMESEFFRGHFLDLQPANTAEHDVSAGPFAFSESGE